MRRCLAAILAWRATGGWDWCPRDGEDRADGACQDGVDVTLQNRAAEASLERAKALREPPTPMIARAGGRLG